MQTCYEDRENSFTNIVRSLGVREKIYFAVGLIQSHFLPKLNFCIVFINLKSLLLSCNYNNGTLDYVSGNKHAINMVRVFRDGNLKCESSGQDEMKEI